MPARAFLAILAVSAGLAAEWYTAPAGIRPASRRTQSAILPGGRVLAPLGIQLTTGPGPFGLAVAPTGATLVTANSGPGRNSLTILARQGPAEWRLLQINADARPASGNPDDDAWYGVSMGVALSGEHSVFVSEGNSGRIAGFDWNSQRRHSIDLNQNGFSDSYTGDLALDSARGILYALDQANFRVAAIEARSRRILASLKVGRLPFALALSPDCRKLYVANLGKLAYKAIPGADPQRPRETGLSFPAFGFPSPEAAAGVTRQTAAGAVQVAGLGDAEAPESNSVAVVDVSEPAAPKLEGFVRTGLSPSGVLAANGRVYVSNAGSDSVSVIDPATNRVEAEIRLRVPGLEDLRGIVPGGLAFHPASGWLLVAEAGLNAVGVIDTRRNLLIGHLPAGWFPVRVALAGSTVFVANARGGGSGTDATGVLPGNFRDGSVSVFPLPEAGDLPALTDRVLQSAGLKPQPPGAGDDRPLPETIRYVVLIVKEGRSFDEVFGDIRRVSNGLVMSSPRFARFGSYGYVDGHGKRFSFQEVNVTPNHHAIALRWSFSDNFYADSEAAPDGRHWLNGVYPNLWTATSLAAALGEQKKDFRLGTAPGRLEFPGLSASVQPQDPGEAGTIWQHLERHGVSFYNFGEGFELAGAVAAPGTDPTGVRLLTNVPMPEPLYANTSRQYPGFNMNIPDQVRASEFIAAIQSRYVKPGIDLPQFLFVLLPNDRMADERPEAGYPYRESYVLDNDFALGRIVAYLSSTKWWGQMAVFVTEDTAEGGIDHIDAHRTLLLCAGPWAKRGYVSHVNTSFPGLLKTVFRLLHVPPMTLFDASAADLADCFSTRPDYTGYRALDVDRRIFDPDFGRPREGPAPPRP